MRTGWLSGEVYLFDVPTGDLIGSYPVSGTGMYQGTPIGAGSNDNGTVMAFASWGTQNHDWPEVMVFNRSVQLIGQINFPGSAFSVDVSTDGRTWWAAPRQSTLISLAAVGASS